MATETLTLTDFLLARIAEDARRLDCGVNRHDGATGSPPYITSATCECDFRDKREWRAKQQIVAIYEDTRGMGDQSGAAEDMVSALAAVYADHPDYRDEWRP